MSATDGVFRTLQEAWNALDGYAMHVPGCSAHAKPGDECECSLTAARTHLREAA